MELWNILTGSVRIKVISPEPEKLIGELSQRGYVLHNVCFADALTVELTVNRRDCILIQNLLTKHGAKASILQRNGIFWIIAALKRRPVLIAGVTILLMLSMYVPSRIFFVRVTGNQNIPTNLILSRASECGIEFGASRRSVRSERVKNALLQSVPQLQWVGVNTAGSVAVIRVQERALTQDDSIKGGVTNIIAHTDGVIRSCTVQRGTPLCAVGQAVKKGDVLVSGFTDCGLMVKASQAEAEIIAETSHEISALTPVSRIKRGEVTHTEVKYYLQIGKNIIKFSKDSGISDVTCVKMYESNSVVLPGGFQIPVSLVKEVRQYYSFGAADADFDTTWLQNLAKEHLLRRMIAGKVLKEQTDLQIESGVIRFHGKYDCLEIIGRTKFEEILHTDG